jgi:hypothetical protein
MSQCAKSRKPRDARSLTALRSLALRESFSVTDRLSINPSINTDVDGSIDGRCAVAIASAKSNGRGYSKLATVTYGIGIPTLLTVQETPSFQARRKPLRGEPSTSPPPVRAAPAAAVSHERAAKLS